MLGLKERPRLAKKASTRGEGASELRGPTEQAGYVSNKDVVTKEGNLEARGLFFICRVWSKTPTLRPPEPYYTLRR